jgi:hypothetical protein
MTLAMVCMVGLGLTSPALTAKAAGESETNAEAAITKTLETGYGVEIPDGMEFTFTFTQQRNVEYTGEGSQTFRSMDTQVDIDPVKITLNSGAPYADETDLSKRTYKAQSENFLDSADFTSAGIYVYKVAENQGLTGYTLDGEHETMIYSNATYTVYVTVANKADGGTYIKNVSVIDDSQGSKVDATPGDNTNVPDTDKDLSHYTFSQMEFVNKYQKYGGTKPGGGDGGEVNPGTDLSTHALAISKKVAGDTADQNREFSFTVTLKRSAVQDVDKYYGYIVDEENKAVTGKAIEFAATGTATTVQLKHNQKLVFQSLEAGALVSVTEQGTASYTPSADVTSQNVTETLNGTTGQDLKAPGSQTYAVIGADIENSVAFTNTIQDVTPTGIIMNNLPFFMLILAAAAALFAFAVVENRRKKLMK